MNYRRHRGACPFYRENWSIESDSPGEEVLYQIICLMDTPPVTPDEQKLCMHAIDGCWRFRVDASRRNGRNSHEAKASADRRNEDDSPCAASAASQEYDEEADVAVAENAGSPRNGRQKPA